MRYASITFAVVAALIVFAALSVVEYSPSSALYSPFNSGPNGMSLAVKELNAIIKNGMESGNQRAVILPMVKEPSNLSSYVRFVREGGKQGGVVSDKKADTHSCSIFFKG